MAKILVVDDEPDVASEWATALRLAGHDVQVANNSADALELSKANPFDLVVLDFIMPDMTGIDLLNKIRKHNAFVRSIIISGQLNSSDSEEEILVELKGNISTDVYLHKPIKTAQLNATVVELLSKAPAATDYREIAREMLEASKSQGTVRAAEAALKRRRRARKKK
ncbi:MAG TPA: response regulator [Stellaceae bacterium]|nr:response regulator [Stellaceae bacterium]